VSDKIQIIRGDDQGITLYFTDENDSVIDLTGTTVFFTVKKNKADADADAVIASSTLDHVNPTGGRTEIQLTHAETVDLEPGDYFWDAQIKFTDEKIRSVYSDVLTVLPDITLRTS
jgi:hypothetical protein